MTVIRLVGGLGNQLFQLAALERLQARGVRTWCDTSWYACTKAGSDTERPLEISRLLQPREHLHLPRQAARFAYSPRNPRCFRESGPADNLLERLPSRCSWAIGYYQRADHVLAVRELLAARILPHLDSVEEEAGSADRIGVHVRLGDYVVNTSANRWHGVTNEAFFHDGIDRIRADVGPLPLRIYTDSPELLKTWYPSLLTDGAEISSATGSWPALRSMSDCRGIVISNSSFSWWAAAIASLLRSHDVPVVMPIPWFAEPSAADELMHVPGWHTIARRPIAS